MMALDDSNLWINTAYIGGSDNIGIAIAATLATYI